MTDSIRQRIIEAVVAKAAEIRIDKGYQTDMGKKISLYSRHNIGLPFVAIWPGTEEISRDSYGAYWANMALRMEGVREIGSRNKMELSEQIIADIIENVAGDKWTLSFTSGGSHVPSAGDTISGASSGATAILESYSLDSGTWAGGDAAGSMILRRKIGKFESENLNIGEESNVASTEGTISHESAEESTTDDLAEDIIYQSSGLEEYPDNQDQVVGMSVNFIIVYPIILGNPYSQP